MQTIQRRFSWREILMLMTAPLLLFMLGLYLFQPQTPQTSYRRFLSAPLSDGTRYTFRYPTWFDRISTSVDGTLVRLRHHETTTLWAQMLLGVGLHPRRAAFNPFIIAYTMPVSSQPALFAGRRQLGHTPRQHSLTYHRSHISSDMVITPPGKQQYILQYNESAAASHRFQEWDAVIMRSFQVLSPGAPVPSP